MSNIRQHTDVIVIGAGHAGCEAALASARLGAKTVLLTINLDHIAQMSCNPAIGGIAKGHVVREVDALGGEQGRNTHAAAIQTRMLNQSKGPAVHSPRAQCDKLIFQHRMKQVLEQCPNLLIHQAQVTALHTDNHKIVAIETDLNETLYATAFVICSGTFLNGTLHYGLNAQQGGRAGDPAAIHLSTAFRETLGLRTGRLKTGTPPRVLASSLNLENMRIQHEDRDPVPFSFGLKSDTLPNTLGGNTLPTLPCYLTETTEQTADIIKNNLDQSPLYSGRIEGIGTRYCPSFEDKIVRFPHHNGHTIYLEPEGAFTDEYYVNGISTSFPPQLQWELLRTIPGMENVKITRYAYGIEYDFVYPDQLYPSLQVKRWPNLYLAGQINGTSGYEEAAGQGLMAGANAVLCSLKNESPLIIGREQGYIGVMIDDLVTKEIIEPYRLFTSRAEHRLLLRQDNAHRRLTPIAYEAGLVDRLAYDKVVKLEEEITAIREQMQKKYHNGSSLWELLRRPDTQYSDLPGAPSASQEAIKQIEIDGRYDGYIQRELERASNTRQLEKWRIPVDFDYTAIRGLRNEARDKLMRVLPQNLGQATRIDGVTPAEITLLQVHLKRLQQS